MTQAEIEAIARLHRSAFGDDEGPEIADLCEALLKLDETISISAERDGKIVGNVLYTPFVFREQPGTQCHLLAPLGVLPDHQRRGVGKELMDTSVRHLKSIGTQAVFVLGVPGYYPRHGFVPTDKQTPYPDLLTIPEAWMVLELEADAIAPLRGETVAVPPFMEARFWDTSGRG